MSTQIISSYSSYNFRRYSAPWVSLVDAKGNHHFTGDIGTYTGNGRTGGEGDLVVFEPVEGQVYGWGQKDYRNPKYTEVNFSRWDGERFVKCDKLGRVA